jgi:hypothetical protein
MGRTNYSSLHPTLQPFGNFTHMVACWSSSKNMRNMSSELVFNKKSPEAHTKSDFDVLGVHGKLVKYVVPSTKRKYLK